jgi:hypothetical protein
MLSEHYQQLQKRSYQNPQLLGAVLPAMVSGQLNITSQQCTAGEICENIKQLDAIYGWVMYRDSVALTADVPVRTDFIEGEWCSKLKTLKVKHLHGDSYLCVFMERSSQPDQQRCYTEQTIYLRGDLQTPQHTMALYRLWFEQPQSGDHCGRWVPLVQQFIGFPDARTTLQSPGKEAS